MADQFSRIRMLIGDAAVKKLSAARVAVFGVGGVGGHAAEALVRSGVGCIDLIDDDRVCLSNLNRQIFATHSTLRMYKAEAAADRLTDINPAVKVNIRKMFYTPQTAGEFDFTEYDYVVDAIDTVTGKIALVMQAKESGTPIISSMGAGNKLDPTAFEVADIYDTSVCPLARVMRSELRRRGIERLKVVYSKEPPLTPFGLELIDIAGDSSARDWSNRRQTPGSTAFVPAVAGLIIAGEVVKDLSGIGR